MVQHDPSGSNRHQYLAQTVQSYPTASGLKHAPTSARNSTKKWHMKLGLDTSVLSGDFICCPILVSK
jgi:hypothetical protein